MYAAASGNTPGSAGSGVAEEIVGNVSHSGANTNTHNVTPNTNAITTSNSRGTTPQIHNLLNLTSSDGVRSNLSSMSLPLSPNSYSASISPPHNDTNTISSLSPPPQEHEDAAQGTAGTSVGPSSAKPKQKRKPSRKSSTNEEKVLLSTSSPEGIAAASQITPNRIANILIKEGPLPIRHLTGYLIQQVPAFGNLSLSKQRRLIMAALESGDIITGCIFEKIGWGQWEAKIVGKELVKVKIENSLNSSSNNNHNNSNSGNGGVNNTSNVDLSTTPNATHMDTNNQSIYNTDHAEVSQTPVGFYNSNIKSEPSMPDRKQKNRLLSDSVRRESITSQSNENNFKIPTSPTLGPIQSLRNSLKSYADIDEAIESSSDDEFDNEDYDDEDFNLNHDTRGSPPANFEPPRNGHNTAPTASTGAVSNANNNNKNSSNALPKNKIPSIRSPSVSSSRRPSFAGILKPRKPRSSFNQHTLEVALDEGPLERRESRVSFSNSANLSRQSFLRTNISPRLSNNSSASIHDKENENAIADDDEEDGNFTDEEDWQAIGPSSLRKNRHSNIVTPPTPNLLDSGAGTSDNKPDTHKTDEEMAAIALMDLKTV